jgi:hypothetical protein
VKSKARWIPAKAVLGQTQVVTEQLQAPVEPATWVLSAETTAPVAQAVDSKTLSNGLLYGGAVLAGLGLAWLLTRKA